MTRNTVKAIEMALIAGEKSGPPQPFDFDAFKARKRAATEQKMQNSSSPHPEPSKDGGVAHKPQRARPRGSAGSP